MSNIMSKTSSTFLDVLRSQSIKDLFDDIISEIPGLLEKNPVSYYLLFKKISQISVSECIFYSKLDKFFRGIEDIPFEKRVKFLEKQVNGKENEFVKKVLQNIDLIDEEDKAIIVANLQRALFYEMIDIGVFFRLVTAVRSASLEDLNYLLKNRNKEDFNSDISVEFLNKAGLMYSRSIGETTCGSTETHNIYSISDLGKLLIKFGLMYGDVPQILDDNVTFYSKQSIKTYDTKVVATATFA